MVWAKERKPGSRATEKLGHNDTESVPQGSTVRIIMAPPSSHVEAHDKYPDSRTGVSLDVDLGALNPGYRRLAMVSGRLPHNLPGKSTAMRAPGPEVPGVE